MTGYRCQWSFMVYDSQKELSTYHVGYFNGDGDQLVGIRKYTLHFDHEPPVDAFWSVTMYDAKTLVLVENDLSRYAIGDRTEGIQNKDDKSLTL